MKELTVKDFIKLWNQALVDVKEREDEFSKLDAVIGDGDHGTAIVQALTSVVNSINPDKDFKELLNDM